MGDFAALETAVNDRISRIEARSSTAPAAPVEDDDLDGPLDDLDCEPPGRGPFLFVAVAAVVAVVGVALWRKTRGAP